MPIPFITKSAILAKLFLSRDKCYHQRAHLASGKNMEMKVRPKGSVTIQPGFCVITDPWVSLVAFKPILSLVIL